MPVIFFTELGKVPSTIFMCKTEITILYPRCKLFNLARLGSTPEEFELQMLHHPMNVLAKRLALIFHSFAGAT